MRRAPFDLAVAATAVAGLVLLAALSALLAPRTIVLADASGHEGERVAVEARVVALARGTGPVTIADATGRLALFAPRGSAALAVGDEIRAVGVVENGLRGLALTAESVATLVPAPGHVLSPSDLTRAADRYRGTPVAVRGTLARSGGEWRLLDADAPGASVAAVAAPGSDALVDGERGVAEGAFAFDTSHLAFTLTVTRWSPDDP